MKKIQTSSPFKWIMDHLNKGRFVRTYKRSGLNGYKRYIPLKKVYDVLEKCNIKHPRVLRNRLTYIDIEFIEGSNLPENFKKTLMLNLFCSTLFELKTVDCTSIMKYIPYRDNDGYLKDIVDNLILVLDRLNNYEILGQLGLRKEVIVSLKSIGLDNSRPLSLIHGDFSPGNIIMRGNDYFVIDWELATYGDIAYEIATHMMFFEYENEQKAMMLERISQTLNLDINTLVRDIKVYTKFELLRRTFLKLNRAINLAKKGKPFDEILIDGYRYYEQINGPLSMEDMRNRLRDLYRG
jgi:hypothetical protein